MNWFAVKRTDLLASTKKNELDHFAHLEHIFRVAKACVAINLSPEEELAPVPRPRPRRGRGKADISYIAPDFDAPLPEMREYSE